MVALGVGPQPLTDPVDRAVTDLRRCRIWCFHALTDEEVTTYIESLESHNPAFREALVENLDPEQLVQIQYSAHHLEAEDGQRYGRIVTEIAGIFAQGSRAEVQGGEYPINPSAYDKLISTYKEYAPETGEGYALLAEIIHAGQGGDNTWDSDLLTEVGNDLLTYEREHVAEYDSWSWSEVTRDWRPITEQGIHDYGTELPIDPLAMVMDSMHHGPGLGPGLRHRGRHCRHRQAPLPLRPDRRHVLRDVRLHARWGPRRGHHVRGRRRARQPGLRLRRDR